MRVLISGGGIGGPALAVALHRAGIEAQVFEAHTGPATALGSHLSLAPNGLSVLDTLGLLDTVTAAAAFHSDRIEFRNGTGRLLGALDDRSAHQGEDLRTITITRGLLQKALADGAADHAVPVTYGKRLVSHTDTGHGVRVTFADGSTAEGDVLVGADGIHSPVRRSMDPAAPEPAYTGLLNLGGRLPPGALPATPEGTTRMVFGRRAFLGYQTGAEGTLWFVNLPHPEPTAADTAPAQGWKEHVKGLFTDEQPHIAAALDQAEESAFTPLGVYDIASLAHWTRGRVALLGDAAHAMSSSSGQGASQALEDALVLAMCLRDVPDPAAALRTYERLRRDRVERVVAEGRRRGASKLATNRVQVLLRDLFLPVVFRVISRFDQHAWVFEHRIDFTDTVRIPAEH
ncbi:FAD-dependent oxidoreductase [Nocardiopsis sp. NPDC058631]|uniref:FAD-dependent oxidoreductase n=1 Tax=Nocardiopsis sp. NPDC058631 TaxID=3346566 RepID=UPI003654A3B0